MTAAAVFDERRFSALGLLAWNEGRFGEAILCLFGYQLVELDKHQRIRLAKGKTNRQYLREMGSGGRLRRIVEQTMVAFEDFFFRVCLLDYEALIPAMTALKKLMDKAGDVHITGPGTDLKFNIKGMNAIPCGGEYNIPDGEVFTAPIRDSVNGVLQYNCPTIYQGVSFENIRLVFRKGKIVEATSNNTKRLNEILDTDGGARFIGEFAIGFNPHILNPMQDILFDEKIAGSFHFTPGQAYDDCGNGNKSQVHWDMVCIQRPEYGGGEVWFDDKLIRKDGLFVPKSLQKLNPEYLLEK